MMTIKTYLDKDPRGGIGVFAGQDVKAGEIVWRFNDAASEVFSLEDYKDLIARNDKRAAQLKKHAYPSRITMDGIATYVFYHDLDNGSYMNHSENPNTGIIEDPDHPDFADSDNLNIALRDIRAGEELTYDYYSFDPDLVVSREVETCMSFLLTRDHS